MPWGLKTGASLRASPGHPSACANVCQDLVGWNGTC